MLRVVVFWLWMLCCGGSVLAHQIAEMEMSITVEGDRVTGKIYSDAAYLMSEFRGDADAPAQDNAWLRQLDEAGRQQLKEEGEKYLRECLHLLADDQELTWKLSYPDFEGDPPAYLNNGEPEDPPMIALQVETEFPKKAELLQLSWQEPFGVVLVLHMAAEGGRIETTPLVSGETTRLAQREFSAEGEASVVKTVKPSFFRWIVLGFEHILPEGPDHVLFVLGLFLLAPKWKPLLQQTLTFTVAHSISLAAAAFHLFDLSSGDRAKWVEILIAASIAWVGIENLWVKELGKGRVILVGLFGLIHGLGFASVLAELLPADQPGDLPPALFGFNVGVEGGQIAVLLIAFALFGWWGKRFVWAKWTGSVLVGLAGLLLVIERVSGKDILPFL